MRPSFERILHASRPWFGVSAAGVLGGALLFWAQHFVESDSPWILFASVAVAICVGWFARRASGELNRDALWYLAAVYLALGAFCGMVGTLVPAAQILFSLGLLFIAAAVFGESSLRFSDIRSSILGLGAALRERYSSLRTAFLLLVIAAVLRLTYLAISPVVVIGLSAGEWEKGLVLGDSLAGSIFVYVALRFFVESRFARMVGALAWFAASARIGPELAHFAPTALTPLLAMLVLSLGRALNSRARIFLVAFVVPLLIAVIAPEMLLSWLLLNLAAAMTRVGFYAKTAVDLWWTVAGTLLAMILALALSPIFPSSNLLISAELDRGLRDLSSDGIWPWEIAYPSLLGSFGMLTADLYGAAGRTGNLLLIACGGGAALVVSMFFAALRKSISPQSIPRYAILLMVAAAAFGLPSHIASIPLPTFAELLVAMHVHALVVPAASLCLAFGASCIVATLVQTFDRGRDVAAILAVLSALALDILPNGSLTTDARTSDMAQAIEYAKPVAATSVLFASRHEDDPLALYGAFLRHSLGSTDMLQKVLPGDGVAVESLVDRRCIAVANLAAYNGYTEPVLKEVLRVPAEMTGEDDHENRSDIVRAGFRIERIFGQVVVYRRVTCGVVTAR